MEDQAYRRAVFAAFANPESCAYWAQMWCELYGRKFVDLLAEWQCTEKAAMAILLSRAPRSGTAFKDVTGLAHYWGIDPRNLGRILFLCKPRCRKRAVRRKR